MGSRERDHPRTRAPKGAGRRETRKQRPPPGTNLTIMYKSRPGFNYAPALAFSAGNGYYLPVERADRSRNPFPGPGDAPDPCKENTP